MAILEFLTASWDSVLLLLLFALLLVLLYILGHRKIVYKILYSLVTEAEKQFGGGTGELKQAYVMEKLYSALPAVLKALVTAEQLEAWVEDVLLIAKEKWKKNASIDNYIRGGETNEDTL